MPPTLVVPVNTHRPNLVLGNSKGILQFSIADFRQNTYLRTHRKMRKTQLELLKKQKSAYGGSLYTTREARKHKRALAVKNTMHLVWAPASLTTISSTKTSLPVVLRPRGLHPAR